MKIMACILLIIMSASPVAASSTNQSLTAALMAWEYRAFLDGMEKWTNEYILRAGDLYTLGYLIRVPRYDGGYRDIRRELPLTIKSGGQGGGTSAWWIVAAGVGGLLLGGLVAR